MDDGAGDLARLRALAAAGACGLRTGGQWEAWLRHAERFTGLGFTSTMLIWAQCPGAVLLHDYAGWQQRGRQVIRGERGIRLITPDGHVTTVFDLMQTTGEPQAVVIRRARAEGIGAVASLARWLGPFSGTGSEPAAALTMVRHAAWALAGGGRAGSLTGQVEAESVAYLIALRLGLGTGGFTFPPVGSWAGTDPRSPVAGTVATTGERVLAAADKAFAAIEAASRPVTGPRLAAREQATRWVPPPDSPRILEAASRFFTRRLGQGWVPGYLAGRGFSDAVQQQWGIGYAPPGWTSLTGYLRGLGFADQAIEAAGLASRSRRGTLIDVFRDRVMFPVRSADGAVAGFLGRAAPGAAHDVPRYLNTRATGLYRKGQMLFGLHEARDALAAGACPVIVEGPLDAIAVTAGTGGTFAGLAPCGTALTGDQVRLLRRFTSAPPVVAFDGDTAGQTAAVRAYGLLREVAARPLAAGFPDGQDPAAFYRAHGGQVLAEFLAAEVRPLAGLAVEAKIASSGHWLEFDEGKFSALRAVAPLIAGQPDRDIARHVATVSRRLGLTHAEVTTAITAAVADVVAGREPASRRATGQGRAVLAAGQIAVPPQEARSAAPHPRRRRAVRGRRGAGGPT